MSDCLFCKLIKREIPPKFIYETDQVVAFYDIKPRADVHILVVPKKHIASFIDITRDDTETMMEMVEVIQHFTKEKKSDKIGYKIVFNGGRHQEIPHLHWHLLGDVK